MLTDQQLELLEVLLKFHYLDCAVHQERDVLPRDHEALSQLETAGYIDINGNGYINPTPAAIWLTQDS